MKKFVLFAISSLFLFNITTAQDLLWTVETDTLTVNAGLELVIGDFGIFW